VDEHPQLHTPGDPPAFLPALGKPLLVVIVTYSDYAFLNEVHFVDVVFFIVDEGVAACSGLDAEWHQAKGNVVEEL
jgi:hypothetical protein